MQDIRCQDTKAKTNKPVDVLLYSLNYHDKNQNQSDLIRDAYALGDE